MQPLGFGKAPLVCSLLLAAAAVAAQDTLKLPARFTAFAVSTGGPRTSDVASQVEIVIERWSTAAESERLTEVLTTKGPDAALETLRELKPVGRISTPGNLAYDLHYAHQEPQPDGGRRIFLATDRPISYWEAVNQPRVSNYPFTFIELQMNATGEGEGKLALATKIERSANGRHLQLVSYASQPIQLNDVTLQRSGAAR